MGRKHNDVFVLGDEILDAEPGDPIDDQASPPEPAEPQVAAAPKPPRAPRAKPALRRARSLPWRPALALSAAGAVTTAIALYAPGGEQSGDQSPPASSALSQRAVAPPAPVVPPAPVTPPRMGRGRFLDQRDRRLHDEVPATSKPTGSWSAPNPSPSLAPPPSAGGGGPAGRESFSFEN